MDKQNDGADKIIFKANINVYHKNKYCIGKEKQPHKTANRETKKCLKAQWGHIQVASL